MPANIIKSFADKFDLPKKEVEEKWEEAKDAAEKSYGEPKNSKKSKSRFYGTATKILKNKLNAAKKESFIKKFDQFVNENVENLEINQDQIDKTNELLKRASFVLNTQVDSLEDALDKLEHFKELTEDPSSVNNLIDEIITFIENIDEQQFENFNPDLHNLINQKRKDLNKKFNRDKPEIINILNKLENIDPSDAKNKELKYKLEYILSELESIKEILEETNLDSEEFYEEFVKYGFDCEIIVKYLLDKDVKDFIISNIDTDVTKKLHDYDRMINVVIEIKKMEAAVLDGLPIPEIGKKFNLRDN